MLSNIFCQPNPVIENVKNVSHEWQPKEPMAKITQKNGDDIDHPLGFNTPYCVNRLLLIPLGSNRDPKYRRPLVGARARNRVLFPPYF